jgi:hypothetical protein
VVAGQLIKMVEALKCFLAVFPMFCQLCTGFLIRPSDCMPVPMYCTLTGGLKMSDRLVDDVL